MNRKVYKHLLNTYGRLPSVWISLFAEIVRSLINRVYVVIVIANMAASITIHDIKNAKHYAVLYLVTALFAVIITAIADLLTNHDENMMYGETTINYYQKLTNKDMAFYRDSHTGYLTVMLRQYVDSLLLFLRLLKGDFVRMFISLTVPAVVLFLTSWKIGFVATVLVVFQIVYMKWASSHTNVYRVLSHEIYRKLSGEVADDMTNIVAYKSAGREKVALKRIEKLEEEEKKAFWQRRKISVLFETPRAIITVTLTSFSFLLVLNTPLSTGASVKLLILTLTYMFQIIRNVGDLPDLIERHDELVSKLAPTLEILESQHENIIDPNEPIAFSPGAAAISINDMSFRYGESYIFKNLNLQIQGGEHVGIVGLSGAGKSTLANLLMRFDDIESGSIRINDIDIRDISQSNLRQNIAYVPQEPVLFHRSIKENIAYHNDTATIQQIEDAARAAHAHIFISDLPKGYRTIVGERGVKLSGGQKQRVVIARAVLKNAPIILFDEATSALDSESEYIIQQALPEIIGRHTAIIIAHRLSTIAGLDRIIVMHNGKIESEGSHEELLKEKGRYYSLWQKQTHV
jgi:ATP-binding cassette, subfamily B, bacterial